MRVRVFLIGLCFSGCVVRRGGGGGDDEDVTDDGRRGAGRGEDADVYDEFNDLCWEAGDWVRESGCSADSSQCATEEAFHRASGGVCLELGLAWYDCVLSSPLLTCDHDCDPFPTVDCEAAYCQEHPGIDGCAWGPPAG